MLIKRLNQNRFFKEFYRINNPIMISQVFLVSFGFINSMIFGQLGERTISSITIVDKLNGIYWPVISAIATVMTIYFILHSSDKDKGFLKDIFIITNFLMIGISIIFFILVILFGRVLISSYSKDKIIIDNAYFYLCFISGSNIIATWTYALITYFNGVGRVKESSTIAVIQSFINLILYYIFVIKIDKGIVSGVKGIAFAILITKGLELIFYLRVYKIKFSLRGIKAKKEFISKIPLIMKKIIPLVFNNLLFMVASNLIFLTFAKLGTKETASVGISDGLIGNIGLMLQGIIVSSKIIIGKYLSKKKIRVALVYSKLLLKIMAVVSLVGTLIILVFAKYYLERFKIDDTTFQLSTKLLTIAAIFFVFKSMNGLLVDGILRIGSDIRTSIVNDLFGIFIIGVGGVIVLTKFSNLKIELVYTIVYSNELVRLILNYRRYKQKKWLNKIY